MSSRTKGLLDDLVTLLNGGTFSQSFTAEAILFREVDLATITELKVYVDPMTRDRESMTRSSKKRNFTFRVIIAQRVNGDDETDAMCELVEEIEDFLDGDSAAKLTTSGAQRQTNSVKVEPIFDVEMLRSASVFVSEVEIVYWVVS